MVRHIYGSFRKPLLHERLTVFCHPDARGEAIMGALKQREAAFEPAEFKHTRPPTQPDYSDEVTDEQLDDIRKKVADELASERWKIVDGPAW